MYNVMVRKAIIAGFILAFVLAPVMGSVAVAAGNKHQAEAVEHAKEAVAHGKQGHADALVKHAEGALKHAEAAMAETKNPHVGEGIKGLKDGIEHGKAGHADVATKAVEERHSPPVRRYVVFQVTVPTKRAGVSLPVFCFSIKDIAYEDRVFAIRAGVWRGHPQSGYRRHQAGKG